MNGFDLNTHTSGHGTQGQFALNGQAHSYIRDLLIEERFSTIKGGET